VSYNPNPTPNPKPSHPEEEERALVLDGRVVVAEHEGRALGARAEQRAAAAALAALRGGGGEPRDAGVQQRLGAGRGRGGELQLRRREQRQQAARRVEQREARLASRAGARGGRRGTSSKNREYTVAGRSVWCSKCRGMARAAVAWARRAARLRLAARQRQCERLEALEGRRLVQRAAQRRAHARPRALRPIGAQQLGQPGHLLRVRVRVQG